MCFFFFVVFTIKETNILLCFYIAAKFISSHGAAGLSTICGTAKKGGGFRTFSEILIDFFFFLQLFLKSFNSVALAGGTQQIKAAFAHTADLQHTPDVSTWTENCFCKCFSLTLCCMT